MAAQSPDGRAGANILRSGHIEYRVTDLGAARHFYVDLLGFVETARDDRALYLRGLEEREHHSLTLRLAESPGVSHCAYRVEDEDDLDRLARRFGELGLPVRWLEPGEEEAQGRALRAQDPLGLPLEFYCRMERVERLLQRFDLYHGAHVMRLDHFNCQVPSVQLANDFYTAELGFRCSEYTETEEESPRLWAVWLHRKQNVHDLALMNGIGPRVHHAGFWLPDALAVLRACDVLAGADHQAAIERGPGRHGISNALFLYLRDPAGNRIELYASDYQIADPDFAPIRWRINDPKRQTFWGHAAPACWFEEASPVESVVDGHLLPVSEALLQDRPDFVT
ncbi:MAG TPA: 3,4-dihydroxyphenylacetate 2,3-dioxygenase [Thermomicrobiales bacterium]|nr:3,4-dihydroxyphenylacetate 2,3-dioxygenase [Thermomicrobiales bacterium]